MDLVAEGLSVSRRAVQLAFQATGTTVRETVIRMRLRRVRDALISARYARHDIGQLAFAWGFTDLSHFSRRFKAEYGLTPREYRARHAQEPSG